MTNATYEPTDFTVAAEKTSCCCPRKKYRCKNWNQFQISLMVEESTNKLVQEVKDYFKTVILLQTIT